MNDADNESPWRIVVDKTPTGEIRRIVNLRFKFPISPFAYNSELYTPIVLSPINKASTFVVNAYYRNKKLCLCIQDLRIVNDEYTSGFVFHIRANDQRIKHLKNYLNRTCNNNRCVAISFMFQVFFNIGLRSFYAEKILKPKENSTLRSAVSIVQTATESPDDFFKMISNLGDNDE